MRKAKHAFIGIFLAFLIFCLAQLPWPYQDQPEPVDIDFTNMEVP